MGQLGTLLTRAREARGLTIDDAERDTRISKRYLAALEAEEFEVIPAPVYARGFLRSYSQYLGLDPQEALSLFPREDDAPAEYQAGPQRPTNQNPVSAVGPSRPAWKKPPQSRTNVPTPATDSSWEPTIGVDIGVPVPSRRIQTDPAAPARTAAVAIVAVGAILAVVLIAFVISRFAGGEEGGLGDDAGAEPTNEAGADADPTQGTGPATLGTVPSVIGMQFDDAKDLLEADGFVVTELREPNIAPEGQVIDQGPAAGGTLNAGGIVGLTVSEGP
ncbi:MAG: helix-turn-helix domain-containing protein [Tepidiformaceae bacterium]